MRRMGRPGLIGLAARTAVVTGTANAMNSRAANRQHEQQLAAEQAYHESMAQPAPVAAPAPAPAAAPAVDLTAELSKLADLHASGVLTDAEFAAAKARLLG